MSVSDAAPERERHWEQQSSEVDGEGVLRRERVGHSICPCSTPLLRSVPSSYAATTAGNLRDRTERLLRVRTTTNALVPNNRGPSRDLPQLCWIKFRTQHPTDVRKFGRVTAASIGGPTSEQMYGSSTRKATNVDGRARSRSSGNGDRRRSKSGGEHSPVSVRLDDDNHPVSDSSLWTAPPAQDQMSRLFATPSSGGIDASLSTALWNVPRVWQDAYRNTISSSNLASARDEASSFEASDSLSLDRPDVANGSIRYDLADGYGYGNETTFDATVGYSHLEFIIIAIFGAFFSIVTIVGNLMVMISFKMDKQLQTISNYFLLSLAIADFSIGIISMPLFTYYSLYNYWHLGAFVCDTWLAWDYLASNASVLNLLIISFDRYFSAGKKPPPPSSGSKRSTSSQDDEADFRKNSSLYVETCKYLPTSSADPNGPGSLCRVQTPPKGSAREVRSRQRLRKLLLSWCKTDSTGAAQSRDDRDDDSVSSRGSPSAATPASAETPVRDVHFKTPLSSSIRKQATERAAAILPASKASASFHDAPQASALVANAANSCGHKGVPLHSAHGGGSSPSARSFSSDSVYTILIRLPTQSSVELDGEAAQPSIRMILEEERPPPAARPPVTMANTHAGHGHSAHPQAKTVMATTTGTTAVSPRDRLALNNRLVTTGTTKKPPKKKRKHQERKQERKAAKTLSAILFAFIVTWTPYNVLVLIKTLSPCEDDNDCIPQGLWNFAYCLCYINSTVNPLCYALCNANFRRTYIRILSCKWHTTKQRNRGYFS
ncbi:muscarinic acetylcholine receptor DM1-like [Tropilaelaps mercedesae]|uniref:Muscarinic acetylcholine receptor DM1-like n=1 Tax=Tropilaelaps mercedesae TaxID=418985 RepID=A0A1V9X4Q8_9ACAR|nr:muscarinic acetylcholine receptor DM1-like [Tropilaelaps mercedesae]